MTYPRYSAEKNVDLRAGCYVRFVYGGIDTPLPHSHDYYEVFVVAKGTVPHMANNITRELPEGTLMFIRPDDVHTHICTDPETAFINLTFTRETAKLLFAYLFDDRQTERLLYSADPPMIFLDKTSKEQLVTQINGLNTEKWHDKNALKIKMKAILVNIFSCFANQIPENPHPSVPLWIGSLLSEMSKPENFSAGLVKMTELSGKTREHLSRTFKKYYGITVTDYINGIRINYASNLLTNTNMPIIDVCFECGFQNLSYFYQVFKSVNGITPKEFRTAHNKP